MRSKDHACKWRVALLILGIATSLLSRELRAAEPNPNDADVAQTLPLRFTYVGKLKGSIRYSVGAISRDGSKILVHSDDELRIVDSHTLRDRGTVMRHENLSSAFLTSDGLKVISFGGQDVRFWDADSGKFERKFSVNCVQIGLSAISPAGDVIAIRDRQGPGACICQLIDATNGKVLSLIKHEKLITVLAFSPVGDRIASRDLFELHLNDAHSGHEIREPIACDFPSMLYEDRSMNFDKEGHRLLVGLKHGFEVVNLKDGKVETRCFWAKAKDDDLPDRRLYSVAFSADGSAAVLHTCYEIGIGGAELLSDRAEVWDIATGSQVQKQDSIGSVSVIHGQANWLICSPHNANSELWDWKESQKMFDFKGTERLEVSAVAPDGNSVVFNDGFGNSYFWSRHVDVKPPS
jgi:WD40 repeat protein